MRETSALTIIPEVGSEVMMNGAPFLVSHVQYLHERVLDDQGKAYDSLKIQILAHWEEPEDNGELL
jgi:DNA-directed RNA polymerase alpha subunit